MGGPLQYFFKVGHNNCPRGILLSAIVTRISAEIDEIRQTLVKRTFLYKKSNQNLSVSVMQNKDNNWNGLMYKKLCLKLYSENQGDLQLFH